ncbi:hypothetical protein CHL78_017785 [Romboutsia weinsteinii]|uniref:Uncharacterized protein n=1 Tax=Romboutsia weinsteinii TaxID=2020949 RepID=A0A371IYG6_9FIRM|nr:hypothetical protein [Romboutsia weinsteinii]RDY25518.1 hypothetical protein CHL78_017785 [Romboutsia weinsteinii]
MNKKIKIGLMILTFILITFQVLTVGVALTKGYYLIYDWIFYVINYLIIIIIMYIYFKSRWDIKKSTKVSIAVVLIVINSTFLYKVGLTNVLVSKSSDNKHELILKEYPNMNIKTTRLKRRGVIFGRKVDTLEGSATYKAIENKTYKVDWASDDNAVLTYATDKEEKISAAIYNFRSTDIISYFYVLSSIEGKWVDKENKNNYLIFDRSKIVYSIDNNISGSNIYNYDPKNTTQHGVLSLVVKQKNNPTFSIIINSDSEFGEHEIVKSGGSITIVENTLGNSTPRVFYKQ